MRRVARKCKEVDVDCRQDRPGGRPGTDARCQDAEVQGTRDVRTTALTRLVLAFRVRTSCEWRARRILCICAIRSYELLHCVDLQVVSIIIKPVPVAEIMHKFVSQYSSPLLL